MSPIVNAAGNELETGRLRLRMARRRDVSALHEAIAETLPELVRWLPWARPEHGRAETRRYLRGARAAWARRNALELLIEERASKRILGITSVHRIDWARRCAGIGYWVRRSHWELGIASEAAQMTIEHAFTRLSMHRLEAHVAAENKTSQRVIEKLGFTREGLARDSEFVDGRYLDHIQYSLLRTDHAARESAFP